MSSKNFVVKNGLTVGTLDIVDANGNITANSIVDFDGNSLGGITGVTFTAANNNLRITVAGGTTYDTTLSVQADLSAVSQNIVPAANVTYDLGTAEKAWGELFLAGQTITLGGVQIKTDDGESISVSSASTPSSNVKISAATGIEVNGVAIANSSGQLDPNTRGRGYTQSTIFVFPEGDLSGGQQFGTPVTTDAFGVSLTDDSVFTCMEPSGRVESKDLGGLT